MTTRPSGGTTIALTPPSWRPSSTEHDAELEVTTTGRTRVDVVIDGSVGIEVQRSALSKAAALDRTARSVAAGLRSVTWFTALTSDRSGSATFPATGRRRR